MKKVLLIVLLLVPQASAGLNEVAPMPKMEGNFPVIWWIHEHNSNYIAFGNDINRTGPITPPSRLEGEWLKIWNISKEGEVQAEITHWLPYDEEGSPNGLVGIFHNSTFHLMRGRLWHQFSVNGTLLAVHELEFDLPAIQLMVIEDQLIMFHANRYLSRLENGTATLWEETPGSYLAMAFNGTHLFGTTLPQRHRRGAVQNGYIAVINLDFEVVDRYASDPVLEGTIRGFYFVDSKAYVADRTTIYELQFDAYTSLSFANGSWIVTALLILVIARKVE